MAANTTPIFALTPVIGRARLTAANTARDGSGTVTTLVTGGTNGTRIDFITFNSAQATAAASSTMVGRVFISDNAGANYRLLQEILIGTITASNTVIGATQTITFTNGLVIPASVLIGISISVYAGVQDQFDVIARGADY